ncbi:MAG: hypothetical protein ABJE47_12375 [bacterium]
MAFAVLALACGKGSRGDTYARGHGLKVASLPAGAEARVFEAAVHAAFDVDPSLILRVHPRRLARTAGDSGGQSVPTSLVRALRDRGIVLGTCAPIRSTPTDTPRCAGPDAGYIVRASDVFRISPDTVEVYFAAEKFGAASGQKPDALRFEKIYQLVRSGQNWRVVREGRVN